MYLLHVVHLRITDRIRCLAVGIHTSCLKAVKVLFVPL